MARNFSKGPKWIPGTITQLNGARSVLIRTTEGQVWKRHVDHLLAIHVSSGSTVHPTEFEELDVPVATPPSNVDVPHSPPTATMDVQTSIDCPERRYPNRSRRPPERLTY